MYMYFLLPVADERRVVDNDELVERVLVERASVNGLLLSLLNELFNKQHGQFWKNAKKRVKCKLQSYTYTPEKNDIFVFVDAHVGENRTFVRQTERQIGKFGSELDEDLFIGGVRWWVFLGFTNMIQKRK